MELVVIFFSGITNNTTKLVKKVEWDNTTRIPIMGEFEQKIMAPYILITPTYGSTRTGHVPPQVKKFLKQNPSHLTSCVGVIGGGNRNFGAEFAAAAQKLSEKLSAPNLYNFELAGTTEDVKIIKQKLHHIEQTLSTIRKK